MNEQQLLLVFAAILFASGFGTIVTSRNLLKAIMGFQVMIWGVNLALFAGGIINGTVTMFASSLVIVSIAVGASVEALALSLTILVFRRYGTLNPWEIRRLAH